MCKIKKTKKRVWCLTEVSEKISWMVSNLSAYSDVPPPMRFKYNSGAHSAEDKKNKEIKKMKVRDFSKQKSMQFIRSHE